MQSDPRPEAQVVARQFVAAHFPTCLIALLAGSVAEQGGGLGADLDIVIVDPEITPHWATHELAGWPIEIFALTPDTYRHAFALDQRRRWPLHLNLCRTAVVLTDRDGLAQTMRDEAHTWYAQGPSPLSADEIAAARYTLTWMVDDLIDASDADEFRLIGHDFAQKRWTIICSLIDGGWARASGGCANYTRQTPPSRETWRKRWWRCARVTNSRCSSSVR